MPPKEKPKFKFTPVSKELLEMSQELSALGGGDVRIAQLESFCRIIPSPVDQEKRDVVISVEQPYIVARFVCIPSFSSTTCFREKKIITFQPLSNH
jgi:hypothetical protein